MGPAGTNAGLINCNHNPFHTCNLGVPLTGRAICAKSSLVPRCGLSAPIPHAGLTFFLGYTFLILKSYHLFGGIFYFVLQGVLMGIKFFLFVLGVLR